MEKQRDPHPNAAPRDSIASVRKRIETLGLDFHEAVHRAGISRNTGYNLLKGTASLGSLRIIEEWLLKEEAKKPRPKAMTKDARSSEWAELGAELSRLDPSRFETVLEGLRDIVRAKKMEGDALFKMFRISPDRDQ